VNVSAPVAYNLANGVTDYDLTTPAVKRRLLGAGASSRRLHGDTSRAPALNIRSSSNSSGGGGCYLHTAE